LKCREVLTNGVVLHHDNLKTEIWASPSPRIQTSIFQPLKNAVPGHKYANDKEVKDVVHTWLHVQPKNIRHRWY
jgi:hypothetical protein